MGPRYGTLGSLARGFARIALLDARAIGSRVPEDISITGFDDLDLASQLDVGLTTIRVPNREMGALAGASLLAIISGQSAPAMSLLPTRLIVRQSTGAPNSARGPLSARPQI